MTKRQKQVNHPKSEVFPLRVVQAREQLALSQAELADSLGVQVAYLAGIESGQRLPSQSLMRKLAAILARQNPLLRDQLFVLAGFAPPHASARHEAYEALLKNSDPQDFENYLNLVNVLVKSGELALAQEYIDLGFRVYSETLELQMLIAFYELVRKNYALALQAIENAIEFKQRGIESNYPMAELLLNRGVVLFFEGSTLLAQKYQTQEAKAAGQFAEKAMQRFREALDSYLQGLTLESDNILLLDEAARVSFNIADLLDPEAARPYWHNAILLFREVLSSDHKQSLGDKNVRESGCFLAHAYTKSQQWDQARETLGLITTYQPDDWFARFVFACHFALFAAAHDDPAARQRALRQLELALPHQAQIYAMALQEPDLAAIHPEIAALEASA